MRCFLQKGPPAFAIETQSKGFIGLCLFLIAGLLAFTAPAAQETQQVLKGHVPSITRRLNPTGRLDGNVQLHLALGLPLRNREGLTNLLQDIYDSTSPNFRHFLKPDEFTASFGPSQDDYKAIVDFANANGLIVKQTHTNRTMVDVVGSVSDIEKAFHIHMQTYKHPTENRTFFAPDVEPTVDIGTPLLAISGLDNYVTPRPSIRPDIVLGGGIGGNGGGGTGSGGSFMGYDFRKAYAPGVANGGQGQSVALFELTGYYPGDITDYESNCSPVLPGVPLQNIYIDGFDGDDTNYQYAVECTADIEMCVAMAPNLDKIYVYEGPTPLYDAPVAQSPVQYSSTTAQINDVLNQIATDDFANQISCSYGMDINLTTVQIFQQYAAQGQSFFVASGDMGAFTAAVDEPADDPYITAVGGTTLTMSSGAWSAETTWLSPPGTDALGDSTPFEASGGGVSLTYSIPWWQQGISMTANQGSTTMRNIPDVALVANNIDLYWGDDPYYGLGDLGLNDLGGQAGTSFAAPLWTCFVALVNQQAAANGQPPVGFINPALYAIGKSSSYHSCFHDITTGKNTNDASPTKFVATAGYDLCTGWGTIMGSNLMKALLQPPTETLVIKPPVGFTSFGPGGGPYSGTTQTYTLSNIGTKPLNWSAAKDSSWLNVSAKSGTLNPGGSTTVTVNLNSTANSFLIASFSGNVSFENLTDGTTQNRQFDLHVGNGDFETGDLTDWTLIGDTNQNFALAGDDVDVGGTNALDGEPDELFVHSGLWGAYLGANPDNASLSQTVPTKAGQQLLVSFWLDCVPYQGSTTPNGFDCVWNDTTLDTDTNLPASGWTNLQFIVSATGPSSTLKFDFNNSPGAFGLDDVFVGSVPGPVFESASLKSGTMTLSWTTYSNVYYQVQSATNLANNSWTNVGGAILATSNKLSRAESVGNAPQRFYRLEIVSGP